MDTETVHDEDSAVGCPSDSVSHGCLRVNSCSSSEGETDRHMLGGEGVVGRRREETSESSCPSESAPIVCDFVSRFCISHLGHS